MGTSRAIPDQSLPFSRLDLKLLGTQNITIYPPLENLEDIRSGRVLIILKSDGNQMLSHINHLKLFDPRSLLKACRASPSKNLGQGWGHEKTGTTHFFKKEAGTLHIAFKTVALNDCLVENSGIINVCAKNIKLSNVLFWPTSNKLILRQPEGSIEKIVIYSANSQLPILVDRSKMKNLILRS